MHLKCFVEQICMITCQWQKSRLLKLKPFLSANVNKGHDAGFNTVLTSWYMSSLGQRSLGNNCEYCLKIDLPVCPVDCIPHLFHAYNQWMPTTIKYISW